MAVSKYGLGTMETKICIAHKGRKFLHNQVPKDSVP